MKQFFKKLEVFLKPLVIHFVVSVVLISTSLGVKFLIELVPGILTPDDHALVDRFVSKFILIVLGILIVDCVFSFILNTETAKRLSAKRFRNSPKSRRKPRNNNDKEFAPSMA